jgi:hypothetical protein
MFKRLLPLSFIAGLLGALAFAVPAFANNYTSSCLIGGTAHTDPDVQTQGGSGGYTFTAGLAGDSNLHVTCTGHDTSDPAVTEVWEFSNPPFVSVGTYHNIVCGTGTADSTSNSPGALVLMGGTSTFPGTAFDGALSGAAYHILFVAGQGILGWTPASMIRGSIPDPDPTAPSGSTFGGVVEITPAVDPDDGFNPPPPNGNGCTDHFTLIGSISGDYSG